MEHNSYTYREFIDYVVKAPFSERAKSHSIKSSHKEDAETYHFTQTRSFSEAVSLAKNGWDAGIKALEINKDIIISGGNELNYSPTGSFVDIGSYLLGNPNCMVEFVDKTERSKEMLDIYVSLTYGSEKSSDLALKYAKKVIKTLQEAALKYDVKIIGLCCTNYGVSSEIVSICIKDYTENIVLNKFAFAFHPSFFRRLFFKYIEASDNIRPGYGAPMDEDRIKSWCFKNSKKSFWVLPRLQEDGVNWSDSDIFKGVNS